MTATLSPAAKMQFFDNAGYPLVGGKLYSYAAGTTTPLATYVDSAGVSQNTNPIILDSRGEANIWLGVLAYKFVLKTSTDVEIWTVDNIDAPATQSNLQAFKDALAASSGSSLIGFIQSPAGAVARTVQDVLREQVTPEDYGKTTKTVSAISGVVGTGNATMELLGYHTEGDGGGGLFWWNATASKGLHNGGTIIDPSKAFPSNWSNAAQRAAWYTPSGAGLGVWARVDESVIDLKWFGAYGDNIQDDKESLNAFIGVWIVGKTPGYIPAGTYYTSGRVLFDVGSNPERKFPILNGAGAYSSTIRTSNTGSPAFHIYGSASGPYGGPDHFYGVISDIGFTGDTPNVLFAIGLDDLSDNHGNYHFTNCFFGNSNTTKSMGAISLQLNWVFDSLFTNCVTVGNPYYGTSLDLRRAVFTQFDGGSYSNAYFAVLIRDGASYSVTFNTPDIENANFGWYVNDVTAEYIQINNGYFDAGAPNGVYPSPAYGVYVGGINAGGITFNNVRVGRTQTELYGSPGFISPSSAGYRASIFMKGFYRSQTTPAVPATAIAEYNWTGQTQIVQYYGGAITQAYYNGISVGLVSAGQMILRPGDFIALAYTGSPTWVWRAIP